MPRLGFLALRNARGGPTVAILLQATLSLAMLMSARFDQLLVYIGFTLSIFSGLTVCAVFVLRRRRDVDTPFRMPGYPVTPLLYVALMAWMVVHGLRERPAASLTGLGTVAVGWLIHRLCRSGDDVALKGRGQP
jgi:APA family basic amino acid/polyamine antiporter